MAVKQPNNTVICDICHRGFVLTKNLLKEKSITLEKEGLEPTEVTLTVLTCPHCGKHSTVIMDDKETLAIVRDLQEAMAKRLKFLKANKPVPVKLEEKTKKLQRKLDFKRQILANEYNGSFYQVEDGKEQLEFCYHVQ